MNKHFLSTAAVVAAAASVWRDNLIRIYGRITNPISEKFRIPGDILP